MRRRAAPAFESQIVTCCRAVSIVNCSPFWKKRSSRSPASGGEQWAAVAYLAIFGAALTFFLWVFALARTTPTKVTNTITLNPLTASIVATFLVGEPIGLALLVGVAAVFAGILVASNERAPGCGWRARSERRIAPREWGSARERQSQAQADENAAHDRLDAAPRPLVGPAHRRHREEQGDRDPPGR